MKQKISIVRLLSMLKQYRTDMNTLYEEFISPDSSSGSRLMATIYNKNSDRTYSGSTIEDTKNSITKIDFVIKNTFNKYQKLLIVKKTVNVSKTIKIPILNLNDFTTSEQEVSVDTALTLSSSKFREYLVEYIDRLVGDYSKVTSALESQQNKALAQDKIDTYVNAKMNSLGVNPNFRDEHLYESFSKEYIDANRYEILDPLKISEKALEYKSSIVEYFDTIESRIREFNAKTYIWIDLDLDENFWDFV